MGRAFQVAQLDVCREHFLSRCEWVLRKIPQSKYADLFRRTQFFTLKIMFRSYWSFWAIVRENWLNLWFLRNKTNVNRKLAIKPEGGRNLKKWVYRSCVWRRGSRVQSFKKFCQKIVQLLDSGLLEQGCQRAPEVKVSLCIMKDTRRLSFNESRIRALIIRNDYPWLFAAGLKESICLYELFLDFFQKLFIICPNVYWLIKISRFRNYLIMILGTCRWDFSVSHICQKYAIRVQKFDEKFLSSKGRNKTPSEFLTCTLDL